MAPSSDDSADQNAILPFRLAEHARIGRLLSRTRGGFLLEAGCWFIGGTAIVMGNDEYRLSLDVGFLCSSQDGYRTLRQAVTAHRSEGIFVEPIKQLRDFRCDQYGLRTVLEFESQAVKLEIIREGRVDLSGTMTDGWGARRSASWISSPKR